MIKTVVRFLIVFKIAIFLGLTKSSESTQFL
jgi:hypothetical protein